MPKIVIDDKIVDNLGLELALQWFLMASYLYYKKDLKLFEDSVYDLIAKKLLDNYDKFEHRHKYIVTKEDLIAGTLYSVKEDEYPNIVKNSAKKFYTDIHGLIYSDENQK